MPSQDFYVGHLSSVPGVSLLDAAADLVLRSVSGLFLQHHLQRSLPWLRL
jgi:hypothetical protein